LPSNNLVVVLPEINSISYRASENVKVDDVTADIYNPILPEDKGVVPLEPDKFNPVLSDNKEDDKFAIIVLVESA
tara:strand:+ start:632 stop:856 length:225 start_codon:yes stop_codon:yes gene_type:complete